MHIANTDVTFCDGRRIKTTQLDKKVTLGNRYYPIPLLALDTKMGKENIQFRRIKNKNSKSRKPRGDGHQAILNRMKRQTESGRTLTIRKTTTVVLHWNRQQKLLGWGRLKPVLR